MLWLGLVAACGGGSGGGGCPDFATITGGTFTRTGTDLVWTLDVAAISTVTFNQATVPDNVLEYRWGIDLDSNGDGSTDLRVAATHFKPPAAAEVTTADVLSQTQEDVWQVMSNGAASAVGNVTVTLAGNRFTFATNDREDAALAAVTDVAQSTWKTNYFEGPNFDDQCDDSFRP